MKPLLKFLPLLILYVVLVLLLSKDSIMADEVRYYMFADNLAKGFYTESDNPNLLSGPGYPFYLYIFVKLHLPYIAPRFGNAVMIFFSVFFLYKTLSIYIPAKRATILSYCFGLYYPMLEWIWMNFSECLCIFLMCGFMYYTVLYLRSDKPKIAHLLLAGGLLGYLVLTKVLYSYMVFAALFIMILYYLLFRNPKALRSSSIFVVAFLVTVPYLIYTYNLTGRVLYWGSNGGEQLYWMTTHYKGEYGSWIESTTVLRREIPTMHPSHLSLYDTAYNMNLSWVEMNDLFMHRAVENLKNNPKPYLYNVIANAIRLVCDGPISFWGQSLRPYFYLFINSLLMIPLIFSLYPAWLHRQKIPFEIICLGLFTALYFGASVLLVAVVRYFIMVVPFLILWLGFIYTYFIQFTFNSKLQASNITNSKELHLVEND